jgi:hypothetical protein
MEILPHYYFSWIVSFEKQRYTCEMLPLETKQLLDDLKERRGDCHLKEEALDCTMWRAHFGRGFGPVVRQTTK